MPQQHDNYVYIEKQEIESRILKVLTNFEQVNLKTFQWNQDFKQLQLDSLDQISLIVLIEHEFKIVFPDGLFEGFTNIEQIVKHIEKNSNAI
ncbi:hypothetical protein IMG5_052880 [Ichthyophthirius multifiliis]|uniref:Acyl carrier protein n=1 Tax=Ichthyophthirius multifiliis TaxID=5932 RepID=G0QMW4_ICHMU|nr:hypothetical protein IMG5_052880 [Ichthyophthirius multifiliis]EGR33441.1 hypothetical protein IMG5_052880 [Ichthyophthirius multifiliis]|eukprot:XP_004037427.1 hypothetical protein IMG5_052880 [Ichthyophthirius multifiliis]